MVENKRLTIKAEKVDGKTTTLYFLQWVDHFMGHIEKAHEEDIALNVTRSA